MASGEVRTIGFRARHSIKDHEERGGHKMHAIVIEVGGWPMGWEEVTYYNFDPDKVPVDLATEKANKLFARKFYSLLRPAFQKSQTLRPDESVRA